MVDLRNLFLHLQASLRRVSEQSEGLGSSLRQRLRDRRELAADAASLSPWRYCVSKAFVIDADGQRSDEIDLVIHDRSTRPFSSIKTARSSSRRRVCMRSSR